MSASVVHAPLMACRRVTVIHGHGAAQVAALGDVDLELARGERIALLGASGSGKTTLLHVLGGLIVPDQGEVLWQGAPMPSLQAAAHRRGAGAALVFQNVNLLPTFTALENVAFAALAARRGDTAADGDHVATELLELVGLAHKRDALPGELSGGEAQRVALARALAQRPQVLLCDEPTGHLDSETARHVLDLVDRLYAEFGFAQVTATHDADVAARYGRTVGLADGRITGEERFA
jgi:lipoprotein-releasing system ATP-binding protein